MRGIGGISTKAYDLRKVITQFIDYAMGFMPRRCYQKFNQAFENSWQLLCKRWLNRLIKIYIQVIVLEPFRLKYFKVKGEKCLKLLRQKLTHLFSYLVAARLYHLTLTRARQLAIIHNIIRIEQHAYYPPGIIILPYGEGNVEDLIISQSYSAIQLSASLVLQFNYFGNSTSRGIFVFCNHFNWQH